LFKLFLNLKNNFKKVCLTIDLPESFSGTAIDVVTKRKGEMISMEPKGERMICKFKIPSRGIIGLRTFLLTQTGGEAVVTHRYIGYEPYKGDIPGRMNGSLISMENGNSIPFSLNNLQDRGMFFIEANMPIYEGQVIGQHTKANDLVVNVTKTKQLTNMRKSGTDAKVKIAPPKLFSLEEALEYIQEDEYVELTPESIRIRKIYLKEHERKRSGK
jgi:GTP-binding protein